MIDRDTILSILRDAVRAPSGDNSQPWRFEVKEGMIDVYNVPDNDTSPFNQAQVANHIALGACIENAVISASSHSLHADVRVFPDNQKPTYVARISLSPISEMTDTLAPALQERCCNRKAFETRVPDEETLAALASCRSKDQRVVFITSREEIEKLARIASTGERLALENRAIHDFLFDHVTWTPESDAAHPGFYIGTFEFKPPQKAAFKLFSHWPILRAFHLIRIGKLIASDIEKTYRNSGAFGALLISGQTPADYVAAGRTLERVWLSVQAAGLWFQPTTAVHLLDTAIANGTEVLSTPQKTIVHTAANELKNIFATKEGEGIVFMFRIGYGDAPSARTRRKEPEVTFA